MALDANMESNFMTYIFEADLEKHIKMNDTISAIFEAMPMGILLFVNNEIK